MRTFIVHPNLWLIFYRKNQISIELKVQQGLLIPFFRIFCFSKKNSIRHDFHKGISHKFGCKYTERYHYPVKYYGYTIFPFLEHCDHGYVVTDKDARVKRYINIIMTNKIGTTALLKQEYTQG